MGFSKLTGLDCNIFYIIKKWQVLLLWNFQNSTSLQKIKDLEDYIVKKTRNESSLRQYDFVKLNILLNSSFKHKQHSCYGRFGIFHVADVVR